MDTWQREVWYRNWRRRDPLTQRTARTMAEIDDASYRSSFEAHRPITPGRARPGVEPACWLIVAALLIWFAWACLQGGQWQ